MRLYCEVEKLTGPMSVSAVRSRTFSMADLEGSIGGGFTSVGFDILGDDSLALSFHYKTIRI